MNNRQQPAAVQGLGLPSAVIVDVDGTLALLAGRDPFDESLVSQDLPNSSIIAVVRALHNDGHRIIVVSGRTEGARRDTASWLDKHLQVPITALYLRPTGDRRRDIHVKRDIYYSYIAHSYNVLCVLDDRRQVVQLWRSLDLTCLQVAPGDF